MCTASTAGRPVSSFQSASAVVQRAASRWFTRRMTWSCTRWNLPIGTPNCTRCWLCTTDISNTAWQPPTMYEHSTGHARASARSSAAHPWCSRPPSRSLAGTSTPSNVTSACQERKPGSARARTPGAAASTSRRLRSPGLSPVRTATTRCVAAVASLTKSLTPSSRYRSPPRWGVRVTPCGPHEAFGSVMATVTTASPRATRGRIARRWASVAASSTVRAPSTPELKNGPGTGPRPSSSNRTAASVSELSLPPYSAGMRMPGQPRPEALRHSSGVRLTSPRWAATIACRGASRSTKLRADARSSSCGSVSDRSTLGALVLLQTLQRQPAVAPGGPGGHGHRDERRLGDLGVTGAGGRRLLGVGLDAPGALRDLRDAERDQLLGLAGDRAVLERLLVEVEEGAIGVGHQLAHALELRADVQAVEFHVISSVTGCHSSTPAE